MQEQELSDEWSDEVIWQGWCQIVRIFHCILLFGTMNRNKKVAIFWEQEQEYLFLLEIIELLILEQWTLKFLLAVWVTLNNFIFWGRLAEVFIFTRRASVALQNVESSWHYHWSWHCRLWLLCLSYLMHSSQHLSLLSWLLEPRWGQKCWSAWLHPLKGLNPREAPENELSSSKMENRGWSLEMRVHLLQQDRLFTIKSSQEENG